MEYWSNALKPIFQYHHTLQKSFFSVARCQKTLLQAAQKGPEARRAKNRRAEAYLWYVAVRRLSATKHMGLFQQPALGFFGNAKGHGADTFDLGLQHITRFKFFLKFRRVGVAGGDQVAGIKRRHF